MEHVADESDRHVVGRLEAFSDVVIGFSLAEVSFNLVVPRDALALFVPVPIPLIAFGVTFLLVSVMWWAHHRLFATYFVPTRLNIVLHFLSLAGVTFLVYSLQVWLHATTHRGLAYAMYTGSLAWVIGTNALLTYRGILLRGSKMPPQLASRGKWRALRMSVMALALAVSAAIDATLGELTDALNGLVVVALLLMVALRLIQARRSAAAVSPPGTRP